MSKLFIEGMHFYAFHGCMESETLVGNNFEVCVEFDLDTTQAEISDNLEDALDYCTVYEITKKEMEIPSKLIEHVGRRIYNALIAQFTAINSCSIKLIKYNPPIKGKVDKVVFVI